MADPLREIRIDRKKSTQNATLTSEEVSGLQSSVEAGRKSPEKDATKEETPEIPQPTLDEAETQAIAETVLLAEANKLDNEIAKTEIDDFKKTLRRNQQLESRLQPIRLSDVLLRNFVQQEVPVTPEYVLKFRTVDARLELEIGTVSKEMLKSYGEDTNGITLHALMSVTTLACGLVSLSGSTKWAMRIHEASTTEEARELIRKGAEDLLLLPQVALNDMYQHQSLFVARVRKVFNHAGYTAQQVGKS